MIKVKHVMDASEKDDGNRIWVEPVGLTTNMAEWCAVDYALPRLGPPVKLREWFEDHPSGYEFFRGCYHEALSNGPYMDSLRQLASAAAQENFTLLHSGDNPAENCATALYEFISELQAYCPPEE
ncbi:MAG: hypothetical protein JWO48_2413 [Bryobacterales bacterium]|nr:hypothetical protein [Bryobacterales bacterium]